MAIKTDRADTEQQSSRSLSQQDPTSHIADPGPLGLAAFALTTFVLSVFNAGLLSEDLEPVVLPLALFYGGLAQLLAGMWEFRKANTFGALAFSSYGAFWLSFAAYVKFIADGLGPEADKATALYLLAWGIFTAYMTVAAMRVNVSVLAVFIALTLTFLVLALGDFTGAKGIVHTGGLLGLVTAFLAWYGSFAGVANSTWKRTLLPVGPLAPRD
jgi:succinate-acetate transporter protein